jgi:hypothetical protein
MDSSLTIFLKDECRRPRGTPPRRINTGKYSITPCCPAVPRRGPEAGNPHKSNISRGTAVNKELASGSLQVVQR